MVKRPRGNAGGRRVFQAEDTDEFAAFDALHPAIRRYMSLRCPRKISAVQIAGELNKSSILSALSPQEFVRRLDHTGIATNDTAFIRKRCIVGAKG